MKIVALGGNLPHPIYGEPRNTCEAAIAAMAKKGVEIVRRSSWYRTSPVPVSDQPPYINGVVQIRSVKNPTQFLALLHDIEREMGRVRQSENDPRIIDLDLIAWDNVVMDDAASPIIPHPRMHDRAFVLVPLQEIAPDWQHPASGRRIDELIDVLPSGQKIARLR